MLFGLAGLLFDLHSGAESSCGPGGQFGGTTCIGTSRPQVPVAKVRRGRDASSLPPLLTSDAGPLPEASLRELQAPWAAVRSVTLTASARITLRQPDGAWQQGDGSLLYWDDGSRYRAAIRTARPLHLALDMDVAWEGKLYQLILYGDSGFKEKNIVWTNRTDRGIPGALKNPFFMPFQFLPRGSAYCATCVLHLADLKAEAGWNGRRSPGASSPSRGPATWPARRGPPLKSQRPPPEVPPSDGLSPSTGVRGPRRSAASTP